MRASRSSAWRIARAAGEPSLRALPACGIRDWVARDLEALQGGGIDAVMFCNENDHWHRLDADVASVAAMTDVVASLAWSSRCRSASTALGSQGHAGRRRGNRAMFAARFSPGHSPGTSALGSFGGRCVSLPARDRRRNRCSSTSTPSLPPR